MSINALFLNNSVNFSLESLLDEELNGKNAEQINLLFIIARNIFIYIHCYFCYMLFMNCNIKNVINKYIIKIYYYIYIFILFFIKLIFL